MEPLKISAKNLGYTALEDFCPRCYWIKLKTNNKLPWQTFPGIFSSIDAYTKHCIHHIIDDCRGKKLTPEWMQEMGNIVGYQTVPHWSKSLYLDEKTNITISGAADDILVDADDSLIIPDWKTQKKTDNADKLLPMYEVQLITYGIIYRFSPLLFCVYLEPQTGKDMACKRITDDGFSMEFVAYVVPVENDRMKVRRALTTTREIYDLDKAPESREGCKECAALEKVMGLLGMAKFSNAGLEE